MGNVHGYKYYESVVSIHAQSGAWALGPINPNKPCVHLGQTLVVFGIPGVFWVNKPFKNFGLIVPLEVLRGLGFGRCPS